MSRAGRAARIETSCSARNCWKSCGATGAGYDANPKFGCSQAIAGTPARHPLRRRSCCGWPAGRPLNEQAWATTFIRTRFGTASTRTARSRYFRRNHWVPVPAAEDVAGLNRQLMEACQHNEHRTITGREQTVGASLLLDCRWWKDSIWRK